MRNKAWIISCCMVLLQLSCQHPEKELRRGVDRIRAEASDPYSRVYAYAAYLSTTREIEADEAIPMINEMISSGYPLEARYSINNMMDHGIRSYDLLALRGLCYLNEHQPGLARQDLETALRGDPGNEKIQLLLDQLDGERNRDRILNTMLEQAMIQVSAEAYDRADSILSRLLEMDPMFQRALFTKGLIRIERQVYDSALYFLTFANSIEELDEYEWYITWVERVIEGENLIRANPDSFKGYLIQSEALSAIGQFEQAHRILDRGLARQPDHLNLILAKALVWVQSGERETARQYLREQQERGIAIEQNVVNQILQTTR